MTIPNRRPMSAALKTPELSAEALQLIKQGTPEPLAKTLAPVATGPRMEEPVKPPQIAPRPDKSLTTPVVERSRSLAKSEPEGSPLVGMVHLSVRLPAEIPNAVLRASLDRKLKRIKPWTQQEIVTEALMAWLKKNNYLS